MLCFVSPSKLLHDCLGYPYLSKLKKMVPNLSKVKVKEGIVSIRKMC